MKHKPILSPAWILRVIALIGWAVINPVVADTLTVCPVANCQYPTIDAALVAANSGDTIQLGKTQYNVHLGIYKDLTIQGEDTAGTILDGTNSDTVVTVQKGVTVTLKNLTVTHGASYSAGGISNDGNLTLEHCAVTGNKGTGGQNGAGIYNSDHGNLTVLHSTIADNILGILYNGEQLLNYGVALIENSTLSSSRNPKINGEFSSKPSPIYNEGTLTIIQSTVSTVGTSATAIDHGKGALTVNNSSIVADLGWSLRIHRGTQFVVGGSIFAGGAGNNACKWDLPTNPDPGIPVGASLGYNVIGDGSCNLGNPTDRENVGDLKLSPLQVNAPGTTATRALLPESPAIDAVATLTASGCQGGSPRNFDQRGVLRPQGRACDAGAYEFQAPIARDDHYSTTMNQAISIGNPGLLTNDLSPEGLPLLIGLASYPAKGNLGFFIDGSFTYAPNPEFTGQDSFTYTVSDGIHGSVATVTIEVIPDNHPPLANDDRYAVFADHPLNVQVSKGVLVNDSDPDGNALKAIAAAAPSHGSLTLNEDGSFAYSPVPGYTGSDSFTYQTSDSQAFSDIATVSIAVNPYRATLTIVEDAQPDNPANFQFTGDLGSFILDNPATDDGDPNEVSKTFDLDPGTYTVSQTRRLGWFTGNIFCSPNGNSITDIAANSIQVSLAAGENKTCTFVNQLPATVLARVYSDRNGNHQRDPGEPWLPGQTVKLWLSPSITPVSQLTKRGGSAKFGNVQPRTYWVCETATSDWMITTPPLPDPIYGTACYTVFPAPGQTTTVMFGNSRAQ